MQSNGGFMIDDLSAVFAAEGGQPVPAQAVADQPAADAVATPKPLTAKQEAKLRSFLDGALEDITRGYRKRFDPSSSLHTLTSYLEAWLRLLGVLAHVPPYGGGSTNLLISYLLRCSTDICDGIAGYSLAMEIEAMRRQTKHQQSGQGSTSHDPNDAEDTDEDDSDEEAERQLRVSLRSKQLNLVLQTTDLLDRVWAAVLRGNLINLPLALTNAKHAYPTTPRDDAAGPSATSTKAYDPRRLHSTSSLVPSPAVDGRFSSGAAAGTTTGPRESLPIHGGRGTKTVGITDQVRLRNIAVSSREKLFAWMRAEMDAPPPPTMVEHALGQEPANNTLQGTLQVKQEGITAPDVEQDDEDPDMEDVAIVASQSQDEMQGGDADDTEEHRHFQDLFDRKLDPDADDDDDEEGGADVGNSDSDQRLGASVLGTVEAAKTDAHHDKRKREDDDDGETEEEVRADVLPGKRPRAADSETDEADANMSRSELGSVNVTLPDAIGRWDLAFTRLFSRTLRTLSDLSEAIRQRSAKPDFATSLTGISVADEHEAVDDRS